MKRNTTKRTGARARLHRALLAAALLALTPLPAAMPAQAAEVEGVRLPDTVAVDGATLRLNGAGVRTKFFFDIYVGALYLARPAHTAREVLDDPGPKRVRMVFLYDHVDRERMAHGWREGFRRNQPARAMAALDERLRAFSALFGDARRGDVFDLDFLRDGATRVMKNGRELGRIPGRDFQRALLAVWLGRHPADGDLKAAMLGRAD